jgi:hypothetical protein
MSNQQDRRAFLRAASAAGVAWAAGDLLQVEAALAWAAQQVQTGATGSSRRSPDQRLRSSTP